MFHSSALVDLTSPSKGQKVATVAMFFVCGNVDMLFTGYVSDPMLAACNLQAAAEALWLYLNCDCLLFRRNFLFVPAYPSQQILTFAKGIVRYC